MNSIHKLIITVTLLIGLSVMHTKAQTTVGLKLNTTNAYNGYTLFTPYYSNFTYLIDNCGEVINTWQSPARPYYTAYLLDDGSIVRLTGLGNSNADYIEVRDWNDNLVWEWNPTGTDYDYMHSDIAILPNGNFLVILENRLTPTEWITLGGDPNNISNSYSALEGIIEIQPVGINGANIVWEWTLADHIIQDIDATKATYGVVADNPQLWDINNLNWVGQARDQQHFNGIDYHPVKDQIAISCWSCSELLIIDHSTTTAQAAGHTGGNSGKGGDILYRYGNPINYDHGSSADRVFFGQHNTDWIDPSLPHGDKISVFENGNGRPGSAYSRVVILDPPTDAAGNYLTDASGEYLPTSFDYVWPPLGTSAPTFDGTTFYSQYMGGVNMQPNGNVVICEAMTGRFFEVDPTGSIVWHYQNPDKNTVYAQGTTPTSAWSYRAERYQPSHPAFVGKDMSQKGTIEDFNTVTDNCTITSCSGSVSFSGLPVVTSSNTITYNYTDSNNCTSTSSQDILVFTISFNFVNYNLGTISPKIVNELEIDMDVMEAGAYKFDIYSIDGRAVHQQKLNLTKGKQSYRFALSQPIDNGLLLIKVNDGKHQVIQKFSY